MIREIYQKLFENACKKKVLNERALFDFNSVKLKKAWGLLGGLKGLVDPDSSPAAATLSDLMDKADNILQHAMVKQGLLETLNEAAGLRVGDWFKQESTEIYGKVVKILKNGSASAIILGGWNKKPKKASLRGFHPELRKISRDEVPKDILRKIERKESE